MKFKVMLMQAIRPREKEKDALLTCCRDSLNLSYRNLKYQYFPITVKIPLLS